MHILEHSEHSYVIDNNQAKKLNIIPISHVLNVSPCAIPKLR